MRITTPAIVALLAMPGATLNAQVSRGIDTGTDVRVTYHCSEDRHGCREQGRVVSLTADSLTVRVRDGNSSIPLGLVTRLEVKTGRGVSAGRAVGYPVLGILVGGLVGGVIGYASCAPCDYELEGLVPVGMAAIGGGMGFATGLFIGLLPRDRWEDSAMGRVRFGVAPRREGGVQLGLSLSF